MLENPTGAAAYLAAAIDGEGHVRHRVQSGRKLPQRSVTIANTERAFITACERCCDVLGIEYRIYLRQEEGRRRPIYYFVIGRRASLEKVATIPLQHPEKRTSLHQALSSYRKLPPVDRIRELATEETSSQEIADTLGLTLGVVNYWRTKLGLPRCSPGRRKRDHPVQDWYRAYENGQTYEEIARSAGVSLGVVWRRLRELRGDGRQSGETRIMRSAARARIAP